MEEHFKNKLKNHKVDWDKEELLDNIQKELSQKNRSRFGGRWFLLLPLLFISTCWGVLQINSSSKNVIDIEQTISYDFNNSKINNNDSSVADFNESGNNKTISKQISPNSNENQAAQLNRTLSSEEKTASNSLSFLNINSSSKNKSENVFSFKKETVSGNISSESASLSTSTNTNTSTNASTNTNSFASSKKAATPLTIKPNTIDYISKDRKEIKAMERLPLLELASLACENEIPTSSNFIKVRGFNQEQKVKIAQSKKYFISSGTGKIGLVNRTIDATTNEQEHRKDLKLNQETINSRFLLSTDVTLGYQHQSGWSLESGLEYNRIVEFFKFDDTLSYEIIDGNDKAFYFLDQNLDTLFFSDSTPYINSEIRKVRHNNYHSYFNIPLILGYHYKIRKANIFSTIGINYAFGQTFKGREILVDDSGDYVVADNPAFELKSRIGFQLGIGVEYPLSQRSHFFTKLAYQRSPKLSRAGLEQSYHAYSLGIGIKVFID